MYIYKCPTCQLRLAVRNHLGQRGKLEAYGSDPACDYILLGVHVVLGFQHGPVVRNSPANAGETGDMGLIPGSGRSPGVGNGNPLQCSCLEDLMDRGVWWAIVHGVAKSHT